MANRTIEIITGRERRRRWGIAEKLRIVAECREPGTRVCDVAARHDVCPSLLHTWRALLLTFAPGAHAEEPKPMLMFVQTADDLKVDAATQTLRLVKVGQQTLYLADRPVRLAGHVKMADYLTEWTAKAGADNFSKDPPNATISVLEPEKSENTLAAVTITNPRVDGADLLYNYKLVDGALPAAGGATSIFIDWIGVGGGVGPGFHGVGVGRRGVGWR